MATPYVKQTWIDGDSTKPTSAARLGVIETGVFDAHYRPSVSVSRSTAQAIVTGTTTVITFDTEQFDTDGMHSTVTNTGRLTAAVTAKYDIGARCSFVANGTGIRSASIRVNGTTIIDSETIGGNAGAAAYLNCSRLYQLTATDYVELICVQNSGGSLNTGSGVSDLHFEMHVASY